MAYRSGSVNALAALTDNAVIRGDGGTAGVQTSSVLISDNGEMTNPSQPSFLAYLSATATNKTGNSATYTIGTDALTEVFDQGADFNTNGTFTAPVTGRYQLNCTSRVGNCTIATTLTLTILTSNRNYIFQTARPANSGDLGGQISQLCDMDAADTATFTIKSLGEAADTDGVVGGSNLQTGVSGFLQA